MPMKQILILSWFLFASANSQASTCEAAVADSQHAVVIRQIQQLNYKILPSADTIKPGEYPAQWSWLYAFLKFEEYRYGRGETLPDDLKAQIVANFGSHYEFKDFTDVHFRQFYINSLRSLYVRVAAFWTQTELVRLNGGPLDEDVARIAARVLESTSSPWTLKDRELTPVSAEQYFVNRKWEELPWSKIFTAIAAWKKYSPYDFSYDKFSKFWNEQGEQLGLDHDVFVKLQQAASGHESSLFCCLSEPGCNNCPHNRRWLK